MLDGCLDWQKNRLVRPASVTLATGKYFADQDLWAQWLDEECDAEPYNRWKTAASSDLFQSRSSYAKAACIEPGSKVEFAEKLESQDLSPTRDQKADVSGKGCACARRNPNNDASSNIRAGGACGALFRFPSLRARACSA